MRGSPWWLWIRRLVELPAAAGRWDFPGRRPASLLRWISAGRGRPIRADRQCGQKYGYRRRKGLRAHRKYAARRNGNLLRENAGNSRALFGLLQDGRGGADPGQANSTRG